MEHPLEYVFIDTSVFQQEQFFKNSGRVSKFFGLAEEGYICILLPIITEKEWHKHLMEHAGLNFNKNEVEKRLSLLGNNQRMSSFFSQFSSLLNTYCHPEEINKVFTEKINQKGVERIGYSYFEDTVEKVFDQYFHKEKPFGPNGKMKEFPDAFVLAALEKYAQEKSLNYITVLSLDKDMIDHKSNKLVVRSTSDFLNDLLNDIPDVNKKEKQNKDIEKINSFLYSGNHYFLSLIHEKIEEYLSQTNHYVVHFNFSDIDEVSEIQFSIEIKEDRIDIISVTENNIEAVFYPIIDGSVQVTYINAEESIWDSDKEEWMIDNYII